MSRVRASRGKGHRLGPLRVAEMVAGLVLAAGIVLAFAGLANGVAEGETRRFDEAALLRMNTLLPSWLDEPMRVVTALGYYWVIVPLLAVAAYAFYRKGERVSAALLVLSTAGGIALTTVLKSVFGRPRPDLFDSGYAASSYAFPSGHATVAVGFYGMLAVLVAFRLSGRRRWVVAVFGATVVLLIGFSRLYLGVHYPTDVMAGFLAAPLWMSAVVFVLFLHRFLLGDRYEGT